MKKPLLFPMLLLAAPLAHANPCATPGEPVILDGVITTRALYIDPNEYGWVPANGFVGYDVFVASRPFCFEEKDETSGQTTRIDRASIIQISAPRLKHEDKAEGVPAQIRGQLSTRESAHHFQELLMVPAQIQVKK